MILDHIHNHSDYAPLHPLFPAAFDHLVELSGRKELPAGRIDLEGDRLYAIVVDGPGKSKAAARMEAHRRYFDIQYTDAGCDLIGWRPLGDCRRPLGYNEAKDVEFFEDATSQWIEVPAGQFAVFFPHDVHAPMACDGFQVKKIVIKVAV